MLTDQGLSHPTYRVEKAQLFEMLDANPICPIFAGLQHSAQWLFFEVRTRGWLDRARVSVRRPHAGLPG